MSTEDDNVTADKWEDVNHDISASRIKKHNRCPKQYELRYERDLPGDDGNEYTVIGSLVHDAIENVLNEHDGDFSSQNRLARHLKREFYDLEEEPDRDTELVGKSLRDDALGSLDTAAKYLVKRNPDIRGVEVPSLFELTSLKASAFGYMDVCTDSEIWDWKTGSTPDDDGQDEGELIQGSLYMGAYYHEYGEMPEKIRFVYIKEGTVRSIDASEDNWNRMLQYARRLVNAQRGGEYPAKPSRSKCHWCSYSQFCPADPTSIQQVQAEIDNGNVQLWESV
jgi:CRISPR/Cas system-associated exonuclease Cas4 (RecB family)